VQRLLLTSPTHVNIDSRCTDANPRFVMTMPISVVIAHIQTIASFNATRFAKSVIANPLAEAVGAGRSCDKGCSRYERGRGCSHEHHAAHGFTSIFSTGKRMF
jgi:hypothetical protein